MSLDPREIQEQASALGVRPDVLERVARLLQLLDALFAHAYLRPRLALKGGTAFNLFVFDLPRLSVDIDLNYVGSADREVMLAERPKIEQAIQAVCDRERLTVKRLPAEHAGGKWRLSYMTLDGSSGKLELDLNFMLRVPLWPVVIQDSKPLGSLIARRVPVLDLHELAAGKLAALCSRNASRDLFDARELLREPGLERDRLRLAFYAYGGMNRRDWRDVRLEEIDADPRETERSLIPMLRAGVRPDKSGIVAWTEALVLETRDLLRIVLPPTAAERDFLERLNAQGEIAAEVLTGDETMIARLREHPGLRWKAQNVKRHRGGDSRDR